MCARAQSSELFIRREEGREGVKASTNSFHPTPLNLFLLEQVIYKGPTNSLIENASPTLEVIMRLGVEHGGGLLSLCMTST